MTVDEFNQGRNVRPVAAAFDVFDFARATFARDPEDEGPSQLPWEEVQASVLGVIADATVEDRLHEPRVLLVMFAALWLDERRTATRGKVPESSSHFRTILLLNLSRAAERLGAISRLDELGDLLSSSPKASDALERGGERGLPERLSPGVQEAALTVHHSAAPTTRTFPDREFESVIEAESEDLQYIARVAYYGEAATPKPARRRQPRPGEVARLLAKVEAHLARVTSQ